MKKRLQAAAFLAFLPLGACAPVMEAERPAPTDLSQFVPGEPRINVVEALGAPLATVQQGTESCDVYKLYTGGTSGVAKGAIVAGEAVADVFTLGLTEIVLTPTEAATASARHPVTICYDQNGKLASLTKSDTSVQ